MGLRAYGTTVEGGMIHDKIKSCAAGQVMSPNQDLPRGMGNLQN